MTCQDENHIDEIVKYTPVRMQPYVYALCSEYMRASQSTCTGSYSYVATYNYLLIHAVIIIMDLFLLKV